VQALDKLRVPYDRELLHGYFKQLAKRRRTESSVNLKQLLIQASKQQGNHRKLKRLIEMATHQQLIVQFKGVKSNTYCTHFFKLMQHIFQTESCRQN